MPMVTLKPSGISSNNWNVTSGFTADGAVQTNDGATSVISANETSGKSCIYTFDNMPGDFVCASNIVVRITAAFTLLSDGVELDATINIGGDKGTTLQGGYTTELGGYSEGVLENNGWAFPWSKAQMNGFTLQLEPVQDGADDGDMKITLVEVDIYYSTEGLANGLVSYWKADDESADDPKVDSYSDNDIPMVGSVDKVTGKLNSAFDYTDASDRLEFVLTDVPPELEQPNGGFTTIQWVKLNDRLGGYATSGLWKSVGNKRSWVLAFFVTGNYFRLIVSTDGSALVFLPSSVDTIADDVWYFVAAWHDPVADELGIYVNGISDTVAHSTGVFNPAGSSYFNIGGHNAGTGLTNGQLDEVAYFNKVKTTAELDQIYNGGAGLPLEDWAVGNKYLSNERNAFI